jgi:hypothetical protein
VFDNEVLKTKYRDQYTPLLAEGEKLKTKLAGA